MLILVEIASQIMLIITKLLVVFVCPPVIVVFTLNFIVSTKSVAWMSTTVLG